MKSKNIDEWKFTNENWKMVLKKIVDYAPNKYGRGKRGYDEDHPLVKRLKITAYELMMIMSFLEDQGLIEYDKQEQNWINLTSKGFDVALQNQSADRTGRINRASLFLSLAITLFALTSLLLGIDNAIMRGAVSVLIVVALLVGGAVIVKS